MGRLERNKQFPFPLPPPSREQVCNIASTHLITEVLSHVLSYRASVVPCTIWQLLMGSGGGIARSICGWPRGGVDRHI